MADHVGEHADNAAYEKSVYEQSRAELDSWREDFASYLSDADWADYMQRAITVIDRLKVAEGQIILDANRGDIWERRALNAEAANAALQRNCPQSAELCNQPKVQAEIQARATERKLAAALKVIEEYFNLEADSLDEDALPEREDIWRFHRDIKEVFRSGGGTQPR